MKKIFYKALVLSFLAMACADEETRSEEVSHGNHPNEKQLKNFQDSLFNVFERINSNLNRNQSIAEERFGNHYVYNINSLSLSIPSNTNCSEKMSEEKSTDFQQNVPSQSDFEKLLERITELESFVLQSQKTMEEQLNGIKEYILLQENNKETKKPEKVPEEVLSEDRCEKVKTSGVYKSQNLNKEVYCETESMFGGGWLVIQQRISSGGPDGENENFDLDWAQYRAGFGTVGEGTEFWLGLESMHQLTSSANYELAVEMRSFDGELEYARYSDFHVAGEDDEYRLTVDGYSGSAGDHLGEQNNMKFSTRDNDNDNSGFNCASESCGWWYNTCGSGGSLNDKNPYWYPMGYGRYSRMMIRRK